MYNVLNQSGVLAELGYNPGSSMLIAPIASRAIVPTVFDGQFIKWRVPFSQAGELLLAPGASGAFFPEDQFKTNYDKPFEIWRMIIRLTAFDDDSPRVLIEPQPTTLAERIRLDIEDTRKTQKITRGPTLISTLLSKNAESWEWQVPYTLINTEGLAIQADSQLFPTYVVPLAAAPAASQDVVVERVRIEITIQGYLLVLYPPPRGS
ncbi:hypothetical protein LCGC14_2036970 [marine sediment metagenome]|uniref:Uncharacterized protein n=1 Tax=marine sediment metagenome TaxID=412755 RepID=A0A0F9FFM5_9ZZZZ